MLFLASSRPRAGRDKVLIYPWDRISYPGPRDRGTKLPQGYYPMPRDRATPGTELLIYPRDGDTKLPQGY